MTELEATTSAKPRTTFLDLPNELILEIANHVNSQTQLSRMSRTNRRLHQILTSELLRRNIRDDGSSAALWAFRNNHIEMLSCLHSHGANLYNPKNMPPRWGTLLGGAARDGNIVMAEVLIQLGVDPMQDCGSNYRPLVAALSCGHDEIAKMLISFLPSLEFPVFADGRTALHAATDWHEGEVVRHLLELGADANFKAPGTKQSTFDELLGEDGVEFWGVGFGEYVDDQEIRDGAFRMLTILLENGAEPDDEAYVKGATSSITRVRLLFCNREVNVSKRKAAKVKSKTHQETRHGRAEADQDEAWQELSWRSANTSRTSTRRGAFPPLSNTSKLPVAAPR